MDGNTGYRATDEGENRLRSQGNGVSHMLAPKRSGQKGENRLRPKV